MKIQYPIREEANRLQLYMSRLFRREELLFVDLSVWKEVLLYCFDYCIPTCRGSFKCWD